MAFQRKKAAAIAVKAPFPGFVEPALATSVEKVPSGERWIHEIKFDGYRCIAVKRGKRSRYFLATRKCSTSAFQRSSRRLLRLGATSAIATLEDIALTLNAAIMHRASDFEQPALF